MSNSVYWVELDVPYSSGDGDNVWGCGARINYNPPATETGILSMPASIFKPSH